MRAKVTDVKLEGTQQNVYLATVSITDPETDEFIVECKYVAPDPNNPMDLPYFAISDSSKILIQSKNYKVSSINLVLKPAVISFTENL
ncbi:hypothetical protein FY034_16415 [Trichlorobacter lovleyi]|uniref:hypothetical protein n=1 Tax=Trichlorobacter lovleyi TaxID=313985 RepID=UPI00223ED6E4|nr:hypothetical protein [Trichlorobacter lovleyi]QOX80451.1 hypothetical protein FY034_16415 [Trichlorobacter lovleyi]